MTDSDGQDTVMQAPDRDGAPMGVVRVGKVIRERRSAQRRPHGAHRAASVVAGALAITLAWPVAAPAWADELTIEERQGWSLEEAREHSDALGFESQDARTVPVTEVDPDTGTSPASAGEPVPQWEPSTIEWPAAGQTRVTVPAEPAEGARGGKSVAADGRVEARAGELKVGLRGLGKQDERAAGPMHLSSFDREVARGLGAIGGLVGITPDRSETTQSDAANNARSAVPEGGKVEVSVDVSHLAGAGGDLLNRLRLEVFPGCVVGASGVVSEDTACTTGVPVTDAKVDAEALTVTGTVTLPEVEPQVASVRDALGDTASSAAGTGVTSVPDAGVVVGVMADTAGATGDWGATALSPSAQWDVSAQTGSFSWSYPLRTSPVPGGLAPDLSLSYSSGSLDGRVASTNNQSSQVGDGWEGNFSGYIERKYVPCTEDQADKNGQAANNANHDTGDLCWKSNNATLVFNGSATELVRDGNTDTWRPKDDDNSVVEHATGGWSTDDDKEYWKLTTADGTQYWFGRSKRSSSDSANMSSTQVVPVYGNHPGEPCYNAQFADSRCSQGYRFNLDYVVDTSGNSMTYFYQRHNNRYGYNNNEGTQPYNRGGQLARIEYGTVDGNTTTPAPAQVVFDYAERCLVTSTFDCAESKLTEANSAYWPDVPQDLLCSTSSGCPEVTSPAFFDRMRLTGVTTQIRQGSAYVDVDGWALAQSFPNPGDGSNATLWLDSITHTGKGGSAADVSLPAVTFHGVALDNRVSTNGAIAPDMARLRIDQITTESGGVTTVAYSPQQCTTSNLPTNPQSNDMRCQPVYWTPQGFTAPQLEYFHHYRVESVVQDSRLQGNAPVEIDYVYGSTGPAWHYDDNELTRPKYRTWGQLRGYASVEKYTGSTGNATAPRLRTEYRYFRGMNGDRDGSGGTKSVKVDGIDDLDQYAGMVRQETTYNGTAVVATTLSTPWRSGSTATDPESGAKSFHTAMQATETRTAVTGGTRTTRVSTAPADFDAYGMPTVVFDDGDTSLTRDDRCTRTTYVRNTTKNILNTVRRVETVSAACDAATVNRPDDVISDERFAYDSSAVGTAPVRGRVTLHQEVDSYSGSTPQYVDVESTQYNTYGQVIGKTDALGRNTTTAYDNSTGLTTRTTATSPDPDGSGALTPHVTVTDLDPAFGVPVKITDPNGKITTGTYDGLGRLKQVWEPGRVQGTDDPTTKYGYYVRTSGMNAVTTETLNWDASAYAKSTVIYDGLLRQRQSQTPSGSATEAGRVINESFYDSRGLAQMARDGWSATGAPVTTLLTSSAAVDSRVLTRYDGAGRATSETFQVGEGTKPDNDTSYLEKWTTTTTHTGDRTDVNPPTGGVPTTTLNDARGNTTELWQYTGASPEGTHHVTSYTYDHADRLKNVTDPENNVWSYGYDLRGRQVSASDPDKGDSTTEYDDAGQVITSTDARGEKLAYTYDALGRKTSLRDDSPTDESIRASWSYDLLGNDSTVKGQLASTSRTIDDVEYTTSVTGYTDRYQPMGQTVTIPSSLGNLAGDYTTAFTYTEDGRVRTQSVPAAGGLGQETLTTFYSATNVADGLTGGFGWGYYVHRADYLPTGELSSLVTGNTYAYQQAMYYGVGTRRLEEVTTTQETGNIDDELHDLRHASYSYDDAGNVLSARDTPDPALGGQPSDQQCFTYDWARRLTNAWTPQNGDCATANRTVAGLGGGDPYWKSYSYDVLGNRETSVLHRTAAAGGDATSTYQQPASGTNSVQPHAVTSVTAKNGAGAALGQSSFTYDNAGNMTGRAVAGDSAQTLIWDAEGELASVASDEDGNGSVSEEESDEYIYSADGDRLARTQDGNTTVYLPGQEITLDGDTGAVSAKRYYTFAGQAVAVRTGNLANTVTSIFSDPHSTGIIQIGNVSNQVVRRYMDPFGAPRDSAAGLPVDGDGSDGSWVGDRGFLDKPEDATGLTAVGARLYDALLGAFISVDPVMDLADPQQWNAYAYANNNPMTFSDPTGLLLGPLIDGAYTAPTAGEPGSGGWQVAANNTGYTGSWNNGGAGKWSKPGTTYTPPVPSAAEQARAQAAAAARAEAQAEARARAEAEQRARENAAAEAEHKQQAGIGEQVGGWLSGAGSWISKNAAAAWDKTGEAAEWLTDSEVGGWIETACGFAIGVVSTACGAVYTAAYARQGRWSEAAVSAVGMVGGGAASKVVANTMAKGLRNMPASALPPGTSAASFGRQYKAATFVLSESVGWSTSGTISYAGNSLIGKA